MNSKHIQIETLKEYLLRTLPDKEAEAIEERYFTDALFFKKLRVAEVQLICDYLDGRLSRGERERFESRYLHVDTLRKLVEDVRGRRVALHRASQRRLLSLALAGVACVAIVSVAIFRHYSKTTPAPTQSVSIAPSPVPVSLVLTPGISKGAGQSTPALTLPNASQPVFLAAQLPAQVSAAVYTVRLLNVDIEGAHKTVWSARGVMSTPQNGSQQVKVELPSASIPPGDYILELEMKKGPIRESYVFRVNPPQLPARK